MLTGTHLAYEVGTSNFLGGKYWPCENNIMPEKFIKNILQSLAEWRNWMAILQPVEQLKHMSL